MAFVQTSEEKLAEKKAHCSFYASKSTQWISADFAARLAGCQCVPQCYGSSWQHMIDFLQSFLLSLLAQLGRFLSFAAREVLRPQISYRYDFFSLHISR
jgi:hypothetical protein